MSQTWGWAVLGECPVSNYTCNILDKMLKEFSSCLGWLDFRKAAQQGDETAGRSNWFLHHQRCQLAALMRAQRCPCTHRGWAEAARRLELPPGVCRPQEAVQTSACPAQAGISHWWPGNAGGKLLTGLTPTKASSGLVSHWQEQECGGEVCLQLTSEPTCSKAKADLSIHFLFIACPAFSCKVVKLKTRVLFMLPLLSGCWHGLLLPPHQPAQGAELHLLWFGVCLFHLFLQLLFLALISKIIRKIINFC